MKYQFQLPDFPGDAFELDVNFWTGQRKLFKNGVLVDQLPEKGRPFIIPSSSNVDFVKAYLKPSFPDMTPQFEINGVKHQIAERLSLLQYIVGALPILLVFIGGAIGAGIGAAATFINYTLFRQTGTPYSKWGKVVGVTLGAYVLYLVISYILLQLLYR